MSVLTVERPLEGIVAVITGNRRGIGAEISLVLAEEGANIAGNYVDVGSKLAQNKERRTTGVATKLDELGVKYSFTPADITVAGDRRKLLIASLDLDTTHSEGSKGIDLLILNAAGGLEDSKPADWAETINVHAQVGLVRDFMPHIRPGGSIVYITSLWAHRYGEVQQLPNYEPVAKTKNMGEAALREMIPSLAEKDIRLLISCGHLIEGTAAFSLFSRYFKSDVEALRNTVEGGQFPTARDLAVSVKNMVLSNVPTGTIWFVGGIEAEVLVKEDKVLNREEVSARLPMYGPSKLLVDTFDTTNGTGTFTVRPDNTAYPGIYADGVALFGVVEGAEKSYFVENWDCEGHFDGEFGDIRLLRAVDQLKLLRYSRGMDYLKEHPKATQMPQIASLRQASFEGMVFPGDTITINNGEKKSQSEIKWKGKRVALVEDMQLKDFQIPEGAEIFEATDAIEAAAQALGLSFLVKEQGQGLALFSAIKEAKFNRPILLGETLILKPEITNRGGKGLTGNCGIMIGDEVVGEVNGIELALAPNERIARRIVRQQQGLREIGARS